MNAFYNEERTILTRRRRNRFCLLSILSGTAGLTLCILLCLSSRTLNAAYHCGAAIALSTLSGWAAILMMRLGYAPADARYRHFVRIAAEETGEAQGRLYRTAPPFAIPHSVEVIPVVLEDGMDSTTLYLLRIFHKALPAEGTRVRVLTAGKFIRAMEVTE